ncbi:hypothetical protein [Haloarchaeobius litoreus]|uniref:DUF7979 domain-containing protein n=1 Tax=Haloarchaeobius litoreus TaxID=755306 RepID=A0ABD6DDW8_9EURY|nr:hypothetical protein [Haloarchaeobius litoreus]
MVDTDAVLTAVAVLVLWVLILVGVGFFFAVTEMRQPAGHDPDGQSVTIEAVEEPENDTVVHFENLSAEQQREFRRVLNASDRSTTLPRPVELESADGYRTYIEYRGRLYSVAFPTP